MKRRQTELEDEDWRLFTKREELRNAMPEIGALYGGASAYLNIYGVRNLSDALSRPEENIRASLFGTKDTEGCIWDVVEDARLEFLQEKEAGKNPNAFAIGSRVAQRYVRKLIDLNEAAIPTVGDYDHETKHSTEEYTKEVNEVGSATDHTASDDWFLPLDKADPHWADALQRVYQLLGTKETEWVLEQVRNNPTLYQSDVKRQEWSRSIDRRRFQRNMRRIRRLFSVET